MGPNNLNGDLLNSSERVKRYSSYVSNHVSPKSLETQNEKELICPDAVCQMSFSAMDEFCKHVSEIHRTPLKEYNIIFPSVDEYHNWLSHFSKEKFSKPYAAQLQSDGTYVGVLYCSRMENQRTLARYACPPIKVANGSCTAHIRYQLKSDKSVEVYAQMNHCGHDVLQKEVKTPDTSSASSYTEVLTEREEASFNSKDSVDNSIEKSVHSSSFNLSSAEKGLTAGDKRYQVCVEMFETEENYLRILNLLENLFKKPLEIKQSQGEELLSRKEIAMIFSKVPAIIQVHTSICNNLRFLLNNWSEGFLVGKIWADRVLDLNKVYPPYINNYDEALQTLEANQTKPKFQAFMKSVESKPECQKNSLKDMLIRPVQRIPSVLLLLQELLKRTNKGNQDAKWLKGAIRRMKSMLDQTNESRRRSENYHRFFDVCNKIENFPPELITSERDFIKSIEAVVLDAGGVLHKFKERTVCMFLFNDMFVFAKSRPLTNDLSKSPMSQSLINTSLVKRGNSLSRHLSFSTFRRKEKKPFKLICMPFFSAFRSLEVIKKYGIFIAKLRDERGDELCIFQVTNGCSVEMGIDFFKSFIKMQCSDTLRELALEEMEESDIDIKYANQVEECEVIKKALLAAEDMTNTLALHRPSQLRRAFSSVSLRISNGIHRF